jgi:hypothetical protein
MILAIVPFGTPYATRFAQSKIAATATFCQPSWLTFYFLQLAQQATTGSAHRSMI